MIKGVRMKTSNSRQHRVVVAGATGYLGRHLVEELTSRGLTVVAIVRPGKVIEAPGVEIFEAQVTEPDTLRGVCDGADAVFSALGITRQRDDVTYEDIEYHANLNLLREAERSGVERFGVISAIHPEVHGDLAIMESRERFIAELRSSSLESTVVRASGFFSDLEEVFNMAERGRVYLLGDGTTRANPIHGRDLATVCADELLRPPGVDPDRVVAVGGPSTMTWEEIAHLAFDALGTRPRITRVPLWIPRTLVPVVGLFNRRLYDIASFVVRSASIDMTAPEFGTRHLEELYIALAKERSASQTV